MENQYGIIYLITNLTTNQRYIGQTIERPEKYWNKTYCRYTKVIQESNRLIYKAIKKHGYKKFKFNIIKICESREILNIMETFMIMVHHTHWTEGGYNSNWGGDGNSGYKHTKESIEKANRTRKENGPYKHSEDFKKKMSERMKGENHPFYGKHFCTDHLNKISGENHWMKRFSEDEIKKKIGRIRKGEDNSFYGKKHTEETKRKISEKIKGKKLSEETKEKISIALKGKSKSIEARKNMSKARTGIPMSVEARKNMSESAKKAWNERKNNF